MNQSITKQNQLALQAILNESNRQPNNWMFNQQVQQSLKEIQILCKQRSKIELKLISKKLCCLCSKQIDNLQLKQPCKCYNFHKECFYSYMKQNYVEYQQKNLKTYKQKKDYEQEFPHKLCNICNINLFDQFLNIYKQRSQKCMSCKLIVDEIDIKYKCGCLSENMRIHPECWVNQYRLSYYDENNVKCQQCQEQMRIDEFEMKKMNKSLYYECQGCLNNIQNDCFQRQIEPINEFKKVIFCKCGCIYCETCFSYEIQKYSSDNPSIVFDTNFSFQCMNKSCKIDQKTLKQFKQSKIGIQFYEDRNQQLNQSYFQQIKIHTCPGFLLKKRGKNEIIQLDSQKYITMKRQSEDDQDIKNEYEQKIKELEKLDIEIIPCNKQFEIEFDGDQRIFRCDNCGYRDCKEKTCKSPHFNISCELFKKLKEYKNKKVNNSNNKIAIYKVKYEDKLIIVDEQIIIELKKNPNNIIEIIEQINHPFFFTCNLPLELFDPNYDNEWTLNVKYKDLGKQYRGRIKGQNIQYNYPKYKNLKGYGVNIERLYGQQQDMRWLSKNTDDDTHIVGYHGTKNIAAVSGIIANGFQAGAGQAYAGYNCAFTGQKVGNGVYFGATIEVAYGYTSPITIQNKDINEVYRIIFQCRLNSRTVKTGHGINAEGAFYIVNDPRDIKIYRILLVKEK